MIVIVVLGDEHFAHPSIGVLHDMEPTQSFIVSHITSISTVNQEFQVEHRVISWPLWGCIRLNPCS